MEIGQIAWTQASISTLTTNNTVTRLLFQQMKRAEASPSIHFERRPIRQCLL